MRDLVIHPVGTTLWDFMARNVVSSRAGDTVQGVADLLEERRLLDVPVIDDAGRLRGVVAGTAIPLVMDRLSFDPAQPSNIILTTVTNIVGFASFLTLAVLAHPQVAGLTHNPYNATSLPTPPPSNRSHRSP